MKNKSHKNLMYLQQLSDLELFRLIEERDKAALETIFHRYYESLCRFGFTYTKELDIVEETVSDVFFQLWNSGNRIQEIRNPKPYLYVVVKNKLLAFVSTSSMERRLGPGEENRHISSPSIEQQIIDQEEKEIFGRKIEKILCQIPEKSRQVFEMSRLDGLKYKEISEILGISIKTVENHMAYALKIIRNLVIKRSNVNHT
ncbi:RNA polymerase sigma factor [Zobellia nedashkovskayae]